MDLAKLMHRLCNTTNHLKLKFIPYSSFYGGRYEDVKRRLPDISKAERILGFKPKISLERGLTITTKWQKKVMGIDD